MIFGQIYGQKEDNFEVGTLHDHYTRYITESDDGHIWTASDRSIIRQVNGTAELIPFVENMGLDYWDTDINGNLYVRGTELFFPLKEKLHAYDYVSETSRVVWESPDGGSVGYFVQGQDDQSIWIINFRDDSNEVFYSKDGLTFEKEAIYDLDPFLTGKLFTVEFGARGHHGRLFIHPHYHGLLIIDSVGNEVDLPMPGSHKEDQTEYGVVWRLDNTGRLWKFSPEGAFYYDEQVQDFFAHPSSRVLRDYIISGRFIKELPTRIPCILEDSQGRMWMPGPDNFLICIDHEKEVIYDFQENIQEGLNAQNSDVRRLIEDRNGNIWVILNGGTMYIKPKVALFDRYNYDNSQKSMPIYKQLQKYATDSLYQILFSMSKNSNVSSVKEYRGNIYYCHDRAIHRLNLQSGEHITLPFVNTWINDFIIHENKLYTVDKTSVSIDLETLELEELPNHFSGLAKSVPYKDDQYICEGWLDQNGNTGFFLINGIDWSLEKEIKLSLQGKPLPQLTVNNMIIVQDSILVFNDINNLYEVNIEGEVLRKVNTFQYADGTIANLSTRDIKYITLDLNGDVIVASNEDFIIIDANTWNVKEYHTFFGKMNNNYTHQIIPAQNGYWITTYEQLMYFSNLDSTYTFLTPEDGYSYREIRDNLVLSNGDLVLGTANGLAILDPEKAIAYKKNTLENSSIKLLNYSYYSKNKDQTIRRNADSHTKQTIHLKHSDRQLELKVQLMDLAGAKDHLYSYKIEGYIDQWTEAVKNNTINLIGLQPGSYDILVRAAKTKGLWSNESLVAKLQISQAWYKRWWAFLTYAVLLLGTGYGMYRYRLHQIIRYERLRTRISSDLHDDVGTILTSVAMQSEFLGQNAPQEKAEWYEDLSNLSREAMSRMRDTVWAIDSRKDNMESLVDRMQDFLSDMNQMGKFKINFHHDISRRSEKLPPDIRQNVYLIFKEAVNNAFKYSIGNLLDIQLTRSPKEGLHLLIKDNGHVDSENIKTSGMGIKNLKMRSNRIKGNLDIRMEDGFEVELKV